jgi:DNA-binding NarL/FixJ family response regulator
MEKIKVILSDPQVLFREGIHFVLSGEEDFDVIGETTSNEEGLALMEANPPNVAILSMLNGLNGIEVTRRLRQSVPSVSVILTIDKSDNDQIFLALKSGASACVNKNIDPDNLLDIVRSVAQGKHPLTDILLIPELASKTIAEFKDMATLNEQLENMLAVLAPKETNILEKIAADNTIEQIAAKLNTNEEAIKRDLRAIRVKLIANDHARVLIEAAQRSLPAILRGTLKVDNAQSNYITRAEFNDFKDGLMEHFKSFLSEPKVK